MNLTIEKKPIKKLSNKERKKRIIKSLFTHVTNRGIYSIPEIVVNRGRINVFDSDFNEKIVKSHLIHFKNTKVISIPRKVEHALRYYVSKELLYLIDKDLEIAIEKCLIFLSNFSLTYYTKDKWRCLYSVILHEQFKNGKDNTFVYTKILNCLKQGTPEKGPFIEVKKSKLGKEKFSLGAGGSKHYRLTETYQDKGCKEYVIKSQSLIDQRDAILYKALLKTATNVISKNLLTFYSSVQLPTTEDIMTEAKRLIKLKFHNKKGKKLTMRSGNQDSHWKNADDRVFVEDSIKVFEQLTSGGYIVPIVTGESAGGRVVDSFSLMPSWIRKLCKVNGKTLVEVDYTALHPNIAMSLYGGDEEFITHEKVAERQELPVAEVKLEHISFFNKPWSTMANSSLFPYYRHTQMLMMENIYRDKAENGYKITSQRMFKKEVEIMTKVVEHLNAEGIYVLYVYDALQCEPKHQKRVQELMNHYVIEAGVKTRAK